MQAGVDQDWMNDSGFQSTTSAQAWAKAWCSRFGENGSILKTSIDEATMIGWFANAMMKMYDVQTARLEAEHHQEMMDFTAFMSTRPFCEHLPSPEFLQALQDWDAEKARREAVEAERDRKVSEEDSVAAFGYAIECTKESICGGPEDDEDPVFLEARAHMGEI